MIVVGVVRRDILRVLDGNEQFLRRVIGVGRRASVDIRDRGRMIFVLGNVRAVRKVNAPCPLQLRGQAVAGGTVGIARRHARACFCLNVVFSVIGIVRLPKDYCQTYRKRSCLQGRTETSAPTQETIRLPRAINRPRNDIESGLRRRIGKWSVPSGGRCRSPVRRRCEVI